MPFYKNLNTKTLNTQEIEELLDSRGINKIIFYENFSFSKINKDEYAFVEHIWSRGDRLYKLGNRYYGDSNSFWLIALFNNKPTDADYKYGDIVQIPVNARNLYTEVTNEITF